MHVETVDVSRHARDRCGVGHTRYRGGSKIVPDGLEQESPRSAGRVQHALFQRSFDRLLDHAVRQPVRCVVLAQAVAPVGIDDALVEHLHDIVLHVLPGKAREASRQPGDDRVALRRLDDPVKEVLLDHTVDAGLQEPPAAQDGRRGQQRRVEVHDGVGNYLGRDDEQRMVDEQLIVVPEARTERGP
jgi:hypothetical protein